MLLEAMSAARDLGRLHEIATTLVRYGFGDLVRRLGIGKALEAAGRVVNWKAPAALRMETPERIRRAMEELGPTFVKLGQVFASRADLFPPEYIREFSLLHSRVSRLPFSQLRAQLEEDLGAPPEEIFRELDTEPIAAGSIAQVHRARLADGSAVVLKIRRPNIREKVEADLRLLTRLAERIEDEVVEMRRYRPRLLVRHFARSMRSELDLSVEARNMELIARNLAQCEHVSVPKVYWQWTRERICVQSLLEGTFADDWAAGRATDDGQFDTQLIAARGAQVMLHMVFIDGFFHADPHPGNVVFLPGNRVGLLDFGMVGRLPESRRREFVGLLQAVVERNEQHVVEMLLSWSAEGRADVEMLTQDSVAFIDRYYGTRLENMQVTRLLQDLTEVIRENNLMLPPEVAMLIKTFITLDGLGRLLDPQFDLSQHLRPLGEQVMRLHYSPRAVARRNVRELRDIITGLPRDVRLLLTSIRRGQFKLDLDMRRLEHFGHQLERSANRVTVGLVTSALIVGTAISLTVSGGPTILGMPMFGLLGFASSMIVGVFLLWSILRSGRG